MRNFIANALELRLYIIRYALAPGAHPSKEISLKFEIKMNTFVYISFAFIRSQINCAHSKTFALSCNVQNFFVSESAKLQRRQISSNTEVDWIIFSGTDAGCGISHNYAHHRPQKLSYVFFAVSMVVHFT